MGIAEKAYSKAKEELEQMQNLSADIEDEKQSKYLVIYTKLDDFGKETEQTNKTICYAENIHEAKHKSIMLLSLKNCKVKSVKYMGKLLSYM
jgi:hypothetical protein